MARRSKYSSKVENRTEEYRPKIKLSPQTQAQKEYINTIYGNELIFCTGNSGSGKTYCATTLACQQLEDRTIEKIILTRPAVTSGESFGFLPGELSAKYLPYLEPFLDIFHKHFGISHTENLIGNGRIVAKPLAFMRGITLSNSFIILSEAQNTTKEQMKLFLTRIGENVKVIVEGDVEQKDIKTTSGLAYAIDKLREVDNVGIYQFGIKDCVRSKMVKEIMLAWD